MQDRILRGLLRSRASERLPTYPGLLVLLVLLAVAWLTFLPDHQPTGSEIP